MSRYIDADFEIAHYTSMTTNPTPDVTEKDKRNSLIILDALRMAPSIDIVFCKDCKHTEERATKIEKHKYCPIMVGWVKDTFFCGYGEVRDE